MDPKWILNAEQRGRLERCRDDFRQGLRDGKQLSATCVTGIGRRDVPWDELLSDRHTQQVMGDATLYTPGRKDLAVCIHGERLENIDFDSFIYDSISTCKVLAEASFPGLPADWHTGGIGGTYWIALVMVYGDLNVAGYSVDSRSLFIRDGQVMPGGELPPPDDEFWEGLDIRGDATSGESSCGQVWSTTLSDDLTRMSMKLLDFLLSLAVSPDGEAQRRSNAWLTQGPSREIGKAAEQYRVLAGRFKEYRLRDTKASHLRKSLSASAVQAGRLLHHAVKVGGFPYELREQNGQWWDVSTGRWPGSSAQTGEGVPEDGVFALSWTMAIGSWLVKVFPHRFRQNAAAWDWQQLARDEEGQFVDKDGNRMRVQFSRNGEPMPDGLAMDDPPQEGEVYGWDRVGEPATEADFYDAEDLIEHLRTRAEVYESACVLLAELLEAGAELSSRVPVSRCIESIINLLERAKELRLAGLAKARRAIQDCEADTLQDNPAAVMGDATELNLCKRRFDELAKPMAIVAYRLGIDAAALEDFIRTGDPAYVSGAMQVLRQTQAVAAGKEQETGVTSADDIDALKRERVVMEPGPDFMTFRWGSETFEFARPMQRAALKHLWAAWENGHPKIQVERLRDLVGSSDTAKPSDWFRGHPAWGRLVVRPSQGIYALNSPDTPK